MSEITIKNAQTMLTMDDQRRELTSCDIQIQHGEIVAVGAGLKSTGLDLLFGSLTVQVDRIDRACLDAGAAPRAPVKIDPDRKSVV